MSLIRITFYLSLYKPLRLNRFSGFVVRDLFYNLIKNIDQEEFSSTPILIKMNEHLRPCFKIINSREIQFSFTLLKDKLSDFVLNTIYNGLSKVSLEGNQFDINKIHVTKLEYKEFYKLAKRIRTFTLDFLTPTYFKFKISHNHLNINRKLPIPNPYLMLKSVSNLWKKFSDYNLDLDYLLKWIKNNVYLLDYPNGIRTIKLYDRSLSYVGFVGKLNFEIKDNDNSRVLDTLLRFAIYTNVGEQRCAGFGMINYNYL